MPNRRQFLGRILAGTAGTYVMGGDAFETAAAVRQGESARRQVMVNGRRIRVIDAHAHCIIPVEDIVEGTSLAKLGGGAGNNILGPQRLQVMDQQGVDIQALTINGYWWYAADQDPHAGSFAPKTRDWRSGWRRTPIVLSRWHPWRCSIPSWPPSSFRMESGAWASVERQSADM